MVAMGNDHYNEVFYGSAGNGVILIVVLIMIAEDYRMMIYITVMVMDTIMIKMIIMI